MTLVEYLEQTKLTDAAFAAASGLSQSYVNRLRRGEATKPSADALKRICDATDGAVTANDLLGMQPARQSAEARQ